MFSASKNLIKAIVAVLIAAYVTLILKDRYQLSTLISLVAGSIITVTVFFFIRYATTKFNNNIPDKRLLLLSIGAAGLLITAAPNLFIASTKTTTLAVLKITALGEKNDSAKQSEVWINTIYNGKEKYDLNKISLPSGWQAKYNTIVSYNNQPATLNLPIENPANNIQVVFTRHPWSGKVKIEDGINTISVDLYSTVSKDPYIYTNSAPLPTINAIPFGKKLIISVISFIALSSFCYIFLLWGKLKKNYFILTIPLSIFIFYVSNYSSELYIYKLLPIALSILIYYMMREPKASAFVSTFVNEYSKRDKTIILLMVIYGAFAFFGSRLFLAEYPVRDLLSKGAHFIWVCCWMAFISVAFLYLTALCKQKINANDNYSNNNSTSPAKLYFTFAGIIVLCLSVYLIGFYPANMSADSIDQWEQANGLSKLNNWHPVFHTLFNKLLLNFYNSPVTLALANIFFMAAIAANFLLFLYKQGISPKWLNWAALVFGLIPPNGMLAVTIWKDVPFTISLLWLTLVLAKIVSNDGYLKGKIAHLEVAAALTTAALFRHNGLIVFAFVITGLLMYIFKTKKYRLLICSTISIGLVILYNVYIHEPSQITPNPEAIKLMAPMHGVAGARFYGGELSKETKQEMEKIVPDSTWVTFYNPYSADEYLFFTKKPFIDNLSRVPASKVIDLYVTAFIDNPYLIIRDRLCGTDVVWNVTEAAGSFNYKYHPAIDVNKHGLKQNNNSLKKGLEWILETSVKIADPFLWRAGVYNFLILFLLFLFLKYRRWYILIFIPLIASDLSLMLSMTYQSFRYIYNVPMIFGFLWLLSISNFLSADNVQKSIKTVKQ